ncbi:hypothetical protein CVT24_013035 [Panaeolus cyanescens]|uniref:Oxidase ustYa n=1 Tax=Panaeolus cyanescens TaxID=181874 RepID=A0A409YUL5_9AGAR|nr:hypothetical protein CVT24_013035 [Panaeolus cyanescens]
MFSTKPSTKTSHCVWPWALVLLLNAGLSLISVSSSIRKHQHTLRHDDYPLDVSVDYPLQPVGMTIQDSSRYQLNLTDYSEKEWVTLIAWPHGSGRVHLGEEYRLFNAVYFHQLHCVQIMEEAIQDRHYPLATSHHVGHCLHYLRQTLMCDADYTLEEGDFTKCYENYDLRKGGDTRVCRDWETLYDTITKRVREWAWVRPEDLGHL